MMRFVVVILIFMYALSCFGQTRQEMIEQFKKDRAQMLNTISEIFGDDAFVQQEVFGKKLEQDVSITEKSNADGTVTIVILPKSKDVSLDIKTDEDNISISWKSKKTSRSGSQSLRIPRGYKALSPTQDKKSILIQIVSKK